MILEGLNHSTLFNGLLEIRYSRFSFFAVLFYFHENKAAQRISSSNITTARLYQCLWVLFYNYGYPGFSFLIVLLWHFCKYTKKKKKIDIIIISIVTIQNKIAASKVIFESFFPTICQAAVDLYCYKNNAYLFWRRLMKNTLKEVQGFEMNWIGLLEDLSEGLHRGKNAKLRHRRFN